MHVSHRLLDTILYLLTRLGQPTSLAKLTELLFLLDYTCHKATGRRYLEVKWIRYFYGPWSYEIYEARDVLLENGLIREIQDTKRKRTIRLIDITGEGLRYVSAERLHEIIQKNTVLKEIIRGLLECAQAKSIEEIRSLIRSVPEVRYTVQGKEIEFLQNPTAILQEISRKLEEILHIRPRALSFEEIDKLLNELKEKISRGKLEEHPYWEYYVGLGSLLDIAREVYKTLIRVQNILSLRINLF